MGHPASSPSHFNYGAIHRNIAAAFMAFGVAAMACAQGNPACGVLAGDRPHYGPIDYRKAKQQQKDIVENRHFTPRIENLAPGANTPWAVDLTYTLRVFPNHPRALMTIQRLAERVKKDHPADLEFSVACYFDRAIRYAPDDAVVRMLFASYLIKNGNLQDAKPQLEWVVGQAGDNPFTHFNVGLLFFDMKDFDRALVQAHRSAELGFSRPELRDLLIAAGKWVEPPRPPDTKPP